MDDNENHLQNSTPFLIHWNCVLITPWICAMHTMIRSNTVLGSHNCVFVFLITYSPYSFSMVVKFSVRELSEVKRVSSHHLRLLGFKPLDCLKDYHNLRPSTFIYPSDEVVTLSFMLPESHHYLVVVWTGRVAVLLLQPYP